MKKTLSILLTFLLLLTAALPAFAAEGPGTETFVTVDPIDDQASILVPEDIDETIAWDDVFADIREAVTTHQNSVSLSQYRIHLSGQDDPNMQYIKNYLFYEPVLLRTCSQYSYYFSGTQADGYLTSLVLGDYYKYDLETYNAMVAACEDAMTQILYGIEGNDALSDAQKCVLVHDRLAAWCGYDRANYNAHTIPNESYSAYGPLGLHVGVCQGYSMAYGWMLDKLGIENYYTSSDDPQLNHGWNMVYLDNEPYYVDVTWDDPTWDLYGRVMHSNLLQSFSTFSSNHRNVDDFSQAPVSTLYEDADWVTGTAEMQLIDGKLYYLDSSAYIRDINFSSGTHPGMSQADLNCLDPGTGETTTVLTVDRIGTTYMSMFIPGTGEAYTSVNTRLASIGDKLFYSTASEIRVYDTQTGTDESFYAPDFTQYDSGSKIFGFTQRNGTFYVSISTSYSVNNTEGNTGTVETIPYCEHTDKVTLETITPATCSAGGTVKYICADCRALGTAATASDPSLHSFGDWTTVTYATCTLKGSERRDCANCDAYETRETEIDPDNHVNTEERAEIVPTCVSVGAEAGVWCLDCRKYVTGGGVLNVEPTAHDFGEWTPTTTATCTVPGAERRDCTLCDAFETRGTGLNPANHVNTENRAAVAATCTESGREAGVYCLDCQQYVSGGAIIPASSGGHAFGEWTPTTTATCTVPGVERRDCANCDAFETRATGLDPANHANTENRAAVAATCTLPGREAGVYCLDCKQYISGGAEGAVDPANHVNTEERAAVAATCTKAGREAGVYCRDCKQYISGGAVVSQLPHEYVAVVTEPTCTKGGYTTYTCANCTDSYTADKTAALGHVDADGDQRCDRCNADLSPEANCTCACHKSGFAGFIFKIKVFFWKLFGMNQYRYCGCGKAHW